MRVILSLILLVLLLPKAEASLWTSLCGGAVSERDRPAVRMISYRGKQIPVPIGIPEENFARQIDDWLEQFPTAGLLGVFGSRTHFSYGYLPVLDEKSAAFSDLDVLVHYPYQNLGNETVSFVRSGSQYLKPKVSFVTRNLPDLAQFVRNREFQFPATIQDEQRMFEEARTQWLRHWRWDERSRMREILFNANPYVSAAERRQHEEGRSSIWENNVVLSINKEAILLVIKSEGSHDTVEVLRKAGFANVVEIER